MSRLLAVWALAAGLMPGEPNTAGSPGSAGAGLADPGFLEQWGATNRFRQGQPVAPEPTPDGKAVLFLRSGPRDFVNDLWQLDLKSGEERRLLSALELLGGGEETLSAEERARRERLRQTARGFASFELSEDGRLVLLPLSGRLFVHELGTGKTREVASAAGGFALDPHLSPDGRMVACVRQGDLYVLDLATGSERRLTRSESPGVSYAVAEFAAQEEMGRHRGFWWSPDSRRIALTRVDTAGMEEFTIANPLDPGKPARSWPYPRAGGRNADVRLGMVELPAASAAEPPPIAWLEWDRERYPYLATVVWDRDAPLTFLVQDRAQREELLLAAEPAAGGPGYALRRLLSESDAAWLNLDPTLPRWLDGGRQFLWSTERFGFWTLELRGRDGQVIRPVAGVGLGYRGGLVGVAPGGRYAWIKAGLEPTESRIYRVDLRKAGAKPLLLGDETGVHTAVLGRGGELLVETVDPPGGGKSWSVRRGDGKRLGEFRSVAERPPFAPRVERTTAGTVEVAGVDEPLHALVIRPRDFAAGRRYPVIVSVYGGPHSQTVTAAGSGQLLNQWLADHGFVVVAIDGRGTPARGRAWERAIQGNLIEIPLADQVRGLEALGRRYPEMDLGRVGIYGWSFGGYFAAIAAMRHPEVFRAAVAGAPVADWADYDTHYTERYMGLPAENPDGYRAASALSHAGLLERPLLIVHGTSDDNVYFLHSLKLGDALFRAGKPFEFLPLAGFTHMVPDPLVTSRLYRRIADFLVEHLGE